MNPSSTALLQTKAIILSRDNGTFILLRETWIVYLCTRNSFTNWPAHLEITDPAGLTCFSLVFLLKHLFSHVLIEMRVTSFKLHFVFVVVPNYGHWCVFRIFRDIDVIHLQAEINLLFMMAYLPPGLFDRLRVRCCSLEFDYCNWEDHVLLFVDDHRVLVRKHNYPPGAESSSPAIYIKGRGPKKELESLWEVLLRLVQVIG